MYIRPHIEILRRRLESEKRKFIQIINGPRQTGKTTLILQFLESTSMPCHYASADAVPNADGFWISQQWEAARQKRLLSGEKEGLLVIDEVQKISGWSEFVKKEWDADTFSNLNVKVVLLGSSRLLIQKGLSESLAGRFEVIYLGHWSLGEMEKAFRFSPEEYAWYGGYPGSAELINDQGRWKRYIRESLIETVLSKDIFMLNRVDKPALLRNLFELASAYSGQIISYNKMLGQLQDAGNTTTLSHYLNLLGTAGITSGIEKYYHSQIKQKLSSPKLQVHNTAFISALRQEEFRTLSKVNDYGRIIESTIGAHLINHSVSDGYNLYYWREGMDEVDFVVKYGDKLMALEVKAGQAKYTKGMAKFVKLFGPDKVILIGEEGIRWEDFLRINPLELF